jgi:hypothetical protein
MYDSSNDSQIGTKDGKTDTSLEGNIHAKFGHMS